MECHWAILSSAIQHFYQSPGVKGILIKSADDTKLGGAVEILKDLNSLE